LILAAAASAFISLSAVQTVSPDAAAAEAAVDAFHASLRQGDTRAALALMAEDALVFEQGHAERSRAQYEAEHLGADAEFERAVASTITRRSSGDAGGIAWVSTETRMQGRFRGASVDRVGTETMILRRTDAGWRIVHIHWSSAAHR
jgi:ketosteroid isomerase-like protein